MFDDIPEWRLEQIYADMVKKRREHQSAKLGRELQTWGGKRIGAGRPKIKTTKEFGFDLTELQKKVLAEMGEGSIHAGIQKLINDNM
jgi:hypothetical protein